jgi:hypothetical protein
MSKELIEKLKSFVDEYIPEYPTDTLDSIFEDAPEGDFFYEPDEDQYTWFAHYVRISHSWKKEAYFTNIGRTNGIRWVDGKSCDSCGNEDVVFCFNEEDYNSEDWESFIRDCEPFCSTENYYTGWANYWLDCAIKGTDQLNEYPDYQSKIQDGTWTEFCINSAKDNIKSLEGGQKFLDSL